MSTYERRVAGKRLSRIDGIGKVTGRHVYAADFALPGMLFGKVLRSTEAHARIVRLDVSKARALPGVRTILTAADVPQIRFGTAVKDRAMFAEGKVRFRGEAIAAVAATSLEVAEAALRLIEIQYEPMPAVFDPEESLVRRWSIPNGRIIRRCRSTIAKATCRAARRWATATSRQASPRHFAFTNTASPRSWCIRAIPSRAPLWRAGTATAM